MKKTKYITIGLATITFLSSCGQIDYAKNNLIKPEDFFNQSQNLYGVYYFSESCPMCVDTLPYIETYLNKLSKQEDLYNKLENIYFIDAMVTPIERYTESEDRNAFLYAQIGVTDYNDLLQIGYPLLYIVQNVNEVKTIQDIKIGRKAIIDYITTIW